MDYTALTSLADSISASSEKEKTACEFLKEYSINLSPSDIVIVKGHIPVIKNDSGNPYDVEKLEETHDMIREQLSLFSDDIENEKENCNDKTGSNRRDKESSDGRRDTGNHYRRSNAILYGGYSRFYSERRGWSGEEGEPWTVERQWETFGFVDFLDTTVKSPVHLAELFSIYRNPFLEYFHIVLTRKDRVVRQICVSSGLSGITRAIPASGIDDLRKTIGSIQFDGAYLIHNHPSGYTDPSIADITITEAYKYSVFGEAFRGHIILDHTCFTWIDENIRNTDIPYRPHQIPLPKEIQSDVFDSPAQIAKYVQETHVSGSVLFELDNKHRLTNITPFDLDGYSSDVFSEREKLISHMKANFIRQSVILTDNLASYEKFTQVATKEPVLDCIYVDSTHYKSVVEEHPSCLVKDWQSDEIKKNVKSSLKHDMALFTQGVLFEKQEQAYGNRSVTADNEYESALSKLESKARTTMKEKPLSESDRAYCEYIQRFATEARQARVSGLPNPKLLSIREFSNLKQAQDRSSKPKRSR